VQARNVTTLVTLVMSVCVVLITGVWWSSQSQRFEAPVGSLLGDQWLRMTHPEKVYFVEGYRRGSGAGQADACQLFSESVKNQLLPVPTSTGIVLDRCLGRARNWSKGTEEIVKEIDEFYQRFPDSREVQLTNLIQNLSDQAGLDLDQIHQMAHG